jgi:hypothetical protein
MQDREEGANVAKGLAALLRASTDNTNWRKDRCLFTQKCRNYSPSSTSSSHQGRRTEEKVFIGCAGILYSPLSCLVP